MLREAGGTILVIGFLALLVFALVISAVRRGWNGILTLFAVFAIIAVLGAMFLPALAAAKRKAQNISSVNNLKQIGLAVRIFSGDNNDRLPASFEEMTNELGTDKITYDPATGQRYTYLGGGQSLDSLKPVSYTHLARPVFPDEQRDDRDDDHRKTDDERVVQRAPLDEQAAHRAEHQRKRQRENKAIALCAVPLRPPHDEAKQKRRRLPEHLHRLERAQTDDVGADGKRLAVNVQNFREQKWLAGLRQFNANGADEMCIRDRTNLRQYVLWGTVPVLAVLLFQIVFRRRKRKSKVQNTSLAEKNFWPGIDSEFYRLETKLAALGMPRQSSEPLADWLERALAESAFADLRAPLREIMRLHYRLRFDPPGLDEAGRKLLAQKVRDCLESLARRGS